MSLESNCTISPLSLVWGVSAPHFFEFCGRRGEQELQGIVGIFTSATDAHRAAEGLRLVGFPDRSINLLIPGGAATGDISSVPSAATEQPGMGPMIGGVVGAAIGAAGGGSIAAGVAGAAIPAVGPVVAIGMAAAAILGAAGAAGGAAAGKAWENSTTEGRAEDELFCYEDALRQGRSLVIAFSEDDQQAQAGRTVLAGAGAESVDAARERWWIGLRDAEAEHYERPGVEFKADEATYRRGFEAALKPSLRGKSYEKVGECLGNHCPDYAEEAFRRGYVRGQAHYRELLDKDRTRLAA